MPSQLEALALRLNNQIEAGDVAGLAQVIELMARAALNVELAARDLVHATERPGTVRGAALAAAESAERLQLLAVALRRAVVDDGGASLGAGRQPHWV